MAVASSEGSIPLPSSCSHEFKVFLHVLFIYSLSCGRVEVSAEDPSKVDHTLYLLSPFYQLLIFSFTAHWRKKEASFTETQLKNYMHGNMKIQRAAEQHNLVAKNSGFPARTQDLPNHGLLTRFTVPNVNLPLLRRSQIQSES